MNTVVKKVLAEDEMLSTGEVDAFSLKEKKWWEAERDAKKQAWTKEKLSKNDQWVVEKQHKWKHEKQLLAEIEEATTQREAKTKEHRSKWETKENLFKMKQTKAKKHTRS